MVDMPPLQAACGRDYCFNHPPSGTYVVTFERPIIDPKNPVETEIDGFGSKYGDPTQSTWTVTIDRDQHSLEDQGIKLCPVGRTDSNGVFQLSSMVSEEGAPAGEYIVTFIWPDTAIDIDECECPRTA